MAVKQNYALAQSKLGKCYSNGIGVAKDAAEAIRLYQLASKQGNAEAQVELGLCYQTGAGGLPKNPEEARRLYQSAASQGDKRAKTLLDAVNPSPKALLTMNFNVREEIVWQAETLKRPIKTSY